uniref:Uncharacterized protein n=1 Tax=viral metagenome TaxID=1070528 RepID=A0A6M3IH32_9ZZZZ
MPQLNTNYLVNPIDPGSQMLKAAQVKNYLMEERLAPMKARGYQASYENALLDRERAGQEAKAKEEKAAMERQTEIANRYLKLTEAPSWDVAQKLSGIYGLDISESEWRGNDITILDKKNGVKVSGPKRTVSEAARKLAEDPTWSTDQPMGNDPNGKPIPGTKAQHFTAWAAARGLNIEQLTPEQTLEQKVEEKRRLTRAELEEKEKHPKAGDKVPYAEDKAKLVDDTRAFYSQKAKLMLDPDTGLVRMGPDNDVDKYVREYNELMRQMNSDMVRINKGNLPKWLSEEQPEEDKLKAMPEMPDPVANEGRVIRDTATGKRYRSDGSSWQEIQ